ncbi:MAG: WYL domain-containing protein [Rhodoferax sp.]|nr:WYL domain-containing protein [Rhodoferax sp.]
MHAAKNKRGGVMTAESKDGDKPPQCEGGPEPVDKETIASPIYWKYDSFKDQIEAEGIPIHARLRIHYTNGDGEISIRTVQVSHVLIQRTSLHFVAHCELRNERRAFKVSRVSRAYDLNTCKRVSDLRAWLADAAGVKLEPESRPEPKPARSNYLKELVDRLNESAVQWKRDRIEREKALKLEAVQARKRKSTRVPR